MKQYTISELQEIISENIVGVRNQLQKSVPAALYHPVDYSLEMGGKRIRPLLLLISYHLFSDNLEKAFPVANAIEVFHNFTLLHDDIMDKAEVRRSRPTVHKKFSENNAILSGDVMAFLAYRFLLEMQNENLPAILRLFTQTAIEVCEGQQIDMDFENRNDVSENEYLEMIRLKTAVLLACSLKAGALAANADTETAYKLYDLGLNLGLAFQLQDDLLDSFGDPDVFGKEIGGDIKANKKTFLLIKALESADQVTKSRLINLLNTDSDDKGKVKSVIDIYNQLHIKEITQKKIDGYFLLCSNILSELEIEEEKKENLRIISNIMLSRVF
jgi:geranylgeranyl diphosphate synthase type II